MSSKPPKSPVILKRTYDALAELLNEKPFSPSFREVAMKAGYTASSTAYEHLRALQAQGYVDFDRATPRSLHILKPWPTEGEQVA